MVKLTEGQLEFTFAGAICGQKFDDPQTHQLSVMKAVDFIVEFQDYYLFVEVKDPDNTNTTPANRQSFGRKLKSGKLEADLKYKYRDSFLYRWAVSAVDKPVKYVVLLEMASLQSRQYQVWTDKLKRTLPLVGPPTWTNQVVGDVWVMNMNTWNSIGVFGSVRRV